MSDTDLHRKSASLPDDIAHRDASAHAHDSDCAIEDTLLKTDGCEENLNDAASNIPDNLFLATPIPHDGIKRWARALLKPLIAILTTQYVIVTALAALTALTVASESAKIINTQLAPIIAALKRF
jgi:hypothetical protein